MGRKLRPFALYHQFWLEAIESPLLSGAESSPADLEIACRICACGYGEAPWAIKRKPGPFFAWHWTEQAANRELVKFGAYLTACNAQPDMHGTSAGPDDGVDRSSFPGTLALLGALVRGGLEGGSLEKLWMTPVGQAVWWSLQFARAEGANINLKTAHDLEFEAGIWAQRAAGLLPTFKPEDIDWGPPEGLPGTPLPPDWDR
jgi:hypothetical protein